MFTNLLTSLARVCCVFNAGSEAVLVRLYRSPLVTSLRGLTALLQIWS